MGRQPIAKLAERLTPRQREMLLLTIAAGHASNFSPARALSAWAVRIGGDGRPSVVVTFADSVGRRLLHLGLIELHPDPEVAEVHGTHGIIGRRYVPTEAGIARMQPTGAAQ
jgi:hypothetical protein